MDRIDQGFEFLNYENVCPAEKEILHNILQGTDSQEYSKGLFSFNTPFNDNLTDEGEEEECPVDFEFGQGEGETLDETTTSSSTVNNDSNNVVRHCSNVTEVSANQHNGAILTMPTHTATSIVSQSSGPLPPHAVVPNYYPGHGHLPVSVSATQVPISSVGGPAITNSPSGNQMMMFSPGMPPMIPQQSYYHPQAYYGPGGNNQHMSYVPVDNSGSGGGETYLTHSHPQQGGQGNHHKIHHDAHHSGPQQHSASNQQQGVNSYNNNKGRRKPQQQQQQQQQQQPPPPQPNYYYANPQYYHPVPPYYNQQQLQNVTGHPIIMGPPGVYLPHHPGMYNPQGNDMEHHPQSMVPIPNNDMSFAQHHQQQQHQVYSHNTATTRNYNSPQTTSVAASSRTTPGAPLSQISPDATAALDQQQQQQPQQQQQDIRVGEKSSPTSSNNENDAAPSSSSDTPKSMPDLSNLSSNNGTIVSTPEKETTMTDPNNDDANNSSTISPAPNSAAFLHEPQKVIIVNGAESISSDDGMPSSSIPDQSSSSITNNKTRNTVAEDKKKKDLQQQGENTNASAILKKHNVNCVTTTATNNAKLGEAVPTIMKQVNGELVADGSNKSSPFSATTTKFRDNLSADHNNYSASDATIEVKKSTPEVKSYSNSVSKNSVSQTNNNSNTNTSTTTPAVTPSPPTAMNKTNNNTEVSTVEISKSPTPTTTNNSSQQQQCENNKPNNNKPKSWASIASVKGRDIPYDGAAGRHNISSSSSSNHAQTNHGVVYENTVGGCVDSKLAGSNNIVPTTTTNFDKGHFEFIFDDRYPDENDPIAFRLGEHFCRYPALDHQSIPLAPRGLYNQSNSCFLNAILQALLACPPFVNIFRSLAYILDKTPCKTAPVTQNVFEFVREFTPLIRCSTTTKKDKSRDSFIPGPNLEPAAIRKSLALISKDTFKIEGRQEDAEEFLSFLLNCLHDEMIKVAKLVETKRERAEPIEPVVADGAAILANGENTEESNKDDDDDQWQVMGARNKSCLTRRTAITKSPVSEAFLGQMCLSLSRVNSVKQAHLEPFFTLQLAIQNENIKSVKDALEAISVKEEVSGMTSATGSEIEAWRSISLEELPPILILHLKRFVYEKNGIHKINKKLDYSVDLEIGKELLSTNSKTKYTQRQRQYKLFAVVYHDGEDAHKGHYVADCFHPSGGSMHGPWGWLRYDDTSVKPVSEANMLNPQAPRVPYLLFYRRQDTILQQQSKKLGS